MSFTPKNWKLFRDLKSPSRPVHIYYHAHVISWEYNRLVENNPLYQIIPSNKLLSFLVNVKTKIFGFLGRLPTSQTKDITPFRKCFGIGTFRNICISAPLSYVGREKLLSSRHSLICKCLDSNFAFVFFATSHFRIFA